MIRTLTLLSLLSVEMIDNFLDIQEVHGYIIWLEQIKFQTDINVDLNPARKFQLDDKVPTDAMGSNINAA